MVIKLWLIFFFKSLVILMRLLCLLIDHTPVIYLKCMLNFYFRDTKIINSCNEIYLIEWARFKVLIIVHFVTLYGSVAEKNRFHNLKKIRSTSTPRTSFPKKIYCIEWLSFIWTSFSLSLFCSFVFSYFLVFFVKQNPFSCGFVFPVSIGLV